MLVDFNKEQYAWLLASAPFPLNVYGERPSAQANHCDYCGHKQPEHYVTCSAVCTCGNPHDNHYHHRYDGAPCNYLNRVDL